VIGCCCISIIVILRLVMLVRLLHPSRLVEIFYNQIIEIRVNFDRICGQILIFLTTKLSKSTLIEFSGYVCPYPYCIRAQWQYPCP
jgi:hypothetical protein